MCLGAMFFMIMGWYIMLVIAFSGMLVLGITLLTAGFVLKYINKKKGNDKKYPKVLVIIGGILTIISLIILFIICRIIALIGIFVMGTELLIVGLVSRYTNKKKGIDKKYPKVCIITGGVFMSISLLMFVIGAISYFNGSKYNPATYDPHTSTLSQDEDYCRVIVEEVIRCLDEEDSEGLKSMFSDYALELSDIDTQIDEAMEMYDGKSIECVEYVYSGGSVSVDKGYYYHKGARGKMRSVITDTNNEYYIEVVVVLAESKEPEKEGVQLIIIKNSKDKSSIEIGKLHG